MKILFKILLKILLKIYMILSFNNIILNNLNKLYETGNIPNIIFHGPNMSGKKTLLEKLLKIIYKTD